MRTISASLFAATLAGVSSASAADMPVKAPPRAPIPPSVAANWSGFYIGIHAGYGWGDTATDTTHLPSQAAFNANPFDQTTRTRGYLAGVQAGFNMQSDGFVYGIEADWSYSRMRGSSTFGELPLFGGGFDAGSSQTVSSEMDWFATVRLRLGMAMGGNALLYATGGLALARMEYTVVTDYVGDPFRYPGSSSSTKYGWTAGGGVEMGVSDNMNLRAEYLYFDLGSEAIVANPVAANPPFQVRTAHDTNGHIVRLGLNYRFGAASPVAARF